MDDAVRPVLQELRRLIRHSELSQREVEKAAGFSKGYLSQVLGQNLDLKMRHVLKILDVLQVPPGRFFLEVFEPRLGAQAPPSVRAFAAAAPPLEAELQHRLSRLYGHRDDVVDHLGRRLLRCEQALDQLAQQGILRFENEAVSLGASALPAPSAGVSKEEATREPVPEGERNGTGEGRGDGRG